MFAYTLRRLLFAIPTLLVISFIIFALLDLSPGDPTANLPLTIPPEVREQIRVSLGLGEPFHIRYLKWLDQFFVNEPLSLIEDMTGWQFGDGNRLRVISWQTRSPVVDLIRRALAPDALGGRPRLSRRGPHRRADRGDLGLPAVFVVRPDRHLRSR